MVTMLDCIKRCAPLSADVVDNIKERAQPLIDYLKDDINSISRIYIVGSGTSNNAAVTAKPLMEKVSGLEVETIIPHTFGQKTVYDKNGLYIFISQSGTSTLTKEMVDRMNASGCKTVAISESKDTPVAKKAKCYVDMGCGKEEYVYRTIGYVTTALTLVAIGLRLGLERKHITEDEYNSYLEDARLAIGNHPNIVNKTLSWYDKVSPNFKGARSFIFYGTEDLYGTALEGALKVLEVAKTYLSIGYELEDGLHGPNLGFNKQDIVIALNRRYKDDWLSQGLIKFAKNELTRGYIFGASPIDDTDLKFDNASENFSFIEFAPAVEILSLKLAESLNIPVEDAEHLTPHPSKKYFEMHRG